MGIRKMILTTALIFGMGVFGGLAFAKPANLTSGPIPNDLKLIVTVEGKSFFAERDPGWTWTEAGEYCASVRMKLAEVSTKTQYDALKAAYRPGDFDRAYWTSGRDARLARQFSWNATGNAVSSYYGEVRNYQDFPYQTCVFFWSRPDKDSAFYYFPCSSTAGVLCST